VPREVLQPLLTCDDANARLNAPDLLLKMEGPKGWRNALYSEDSFLRSRGAHYLATMAGSEGLFILREYLEKGKDLEIRLSVLERLGTRGNLLISLVREALAHPWPTLRIKAAWQLQRLPPGAGKRLAEEVLQDEPDLLIRKALQVIVDRGEGK
jgi:hypothetical protein